MLRQPRKKLSFQARLRERIRKYWNNLYLRFKAFVWAVKAQHLDLALKDPESKIRSEAQIALERVVYETDIPPDLISSTIIRGGPAILVKTDGDWEAFIHKTYAQAADKAIEWIKAQGDEIETSKASSMNRKERRQFDMTRKMKRKGWRGVIGGKR